MNRSDQDRASHIEALAEALARLATATKAGSVEGQFDARLTMFDIFVEQGMLAEAIDEMNGAQGLLPQSNDQARAAALRARSATLALLHGDYVRAESLVEEDPDLWFQKFLLDRDLGRLSDDEGEITRVRLESLTGSRATLLALALRIELGKDGANSANYAELFPQAGHLALSPELGSLGPVDRHLGLIAVLEGRHDDAHQHLEAAVRIADRGGLLPWAARARADLAHVARLRGRAGDDELSKSYLVAARSTAAEIGLVDFETRDDIQHSGSAAQPTASQQVASANVFRRDGEYWTISFSGSTFSLRDTKGLLYLARLLASPDHEIHSLDLVRGSRADAASSEGTRADLGAATELTSDPFAAADQVIDAEARDEYRQRLADLDSEISQAEDWNDPERAARLIEERDFLIRELAGAVGLGGTIRTTSSASERARISVSKAIWSSVDRITSHGPELGRHLSLSIHTGTFCSYTPDPALKIVWAL